MNKDGRMMDSNFLTLELHKYVLEDHACKNKRSPKLDKGRVSTQNIVLQDMRCKTKGHCKHTWELGRVVPKVVEVVVNI